MTLGKLHHSQDPQNRFCLVVWWTVHDCPCVVVVSPGDEFTVGCSIGCDQPHLLHSTLCCCENVSLRMPPVGDLDLMKRTVVAGKLMH